MGRKRKTTKEFIFEAKKIHGNEYDYSRVEYSGADNQVIIICKKHGEFRQKSSVHLKNHGCPKCGIEKVKLKTKLSYDIILKANSVHRNKYDYSKLKFNNCREYGVIICKKHGEFKQRINDHLYGYGCKKCQYDEFKLGKNDFIKKSLKIHGLKYKYNNVYYDKSLVKVEIICDKHGSFYQTPINHLSGSGCPFCRESKGEKKIASVLNKCNIKYIREKKFKDCKNIGLLSFDFYLPDKKMLIEYDGEQHFRPINFFGGEIGFRKIKKNDKIKNKYCLDKKIPLLRISYLDINEINFIIKSEILNK